MDSILRRVVRFVSGRLMPRRPYRVLIGPLKGSRFVLGSLSGEGGGASVYFGRMEREQTAAMAEVLKPGGIFFDIGANVGYYTILASRLVRDGGKVVSFEPVPRNLEFLQRHVELNDIENVTVMPFAVSNENSTVRFAIGPNNAMGHIDPDGGLLVETVTLDTIIDELSLLPDVLKMDVEGAERNVLLGAVKLFERAKPIIFLSTHSDELRGWCFEHLTCLGYTVEPLVGDEAGHEFVAKHN